MAPSFYELQYLQTLALKNDSPYEWRALQLVSEAQVDTAIGESHIASDYQ
jgi:hypothetical protein